MQGDVTPREEQARCSPWSSQSRSLSSCSPPSAQSQPRGCRAPRTSAGIPQGRMEVLGTGLRSLLTSLSHCCKAGPGLCRRDKRTPLPSPKMASRTHGEHTHMCVHLCVHACWGRNQVAAESEQATHTFAVCSLSTCPVTGSRPGRQELSSFHSWW